MKKIVSLLLFGISLIILSSCSLLNIESQKPLTYEDFQSIYAKTYYNLLPSSIYDQNLVEKYSNVDFMNLYNTEVNGDANIINPDIQVLDKPEILASDLTNLNFSNLSENLGFTGPVDFVYSNLASVQYVLQYIEAMNKYLEDYGTIAFDNTVITVPGSELTSIPDPLTGNQLDLNDIKAKFITEGNKVSILVSTTDDYSYSDNTEGNFTGTISLYLKVSASQSSVEVQFYLTCDLTGNSASMDNFSFGDSSINYSIGYSMNAVDGKSVVINSVIDSNLNINFLSNTVNDVNQTNETKSSFSLIKQSNGIVADYKVASDMLNTAEINYHLLADNNGATVYLNGTVADSDFYGNNIPSEALNAVTVLDNEGQTLYIGGNVALNIPTNDYYGNSTGTQAYNYAGSAWNLNELSGWTKIKKTTDTQYYDEYELYNGDNILLSAADEQGTYSTNDDKELLDGKIIIGSGISIDSQNLVGAAYIHITEGSTVNLDLPDGVAMMHNNTIQSALLKLSSFPGDMMIDFNKSTYQVPELNITIFQ